MVAKKQKTGVENGPLVSIIMPAYNAARVIDDTIHSVLGQTYKNWELIVVDDRSTDNTLEIVRQFSSEKIKIIELKKNSGAAKARNRGVLAAKGRFVCFLDADDLWCPDKLARQLNFMNETGAAFGFAGYVFADAKGKPNGKVVRVPKTITYNQALKNTTIWTSTVIFDMTKIKKQDLKMPDVKRGQDMATWWKVLKKIDFAYGLDEVVAIYRRSGNTLSSNKIKALKRTWHLYRRVEHFNLMRSAFCFSVYVYNAVRRRI